MTEALVKLNTSLANVRSENSILLRKLQHAEETRQKERAEDLLVLSCSLVMLMLDLKVFIHIPLSG